MGKGTSAPYARERIFHSLAQLRTISTPDRNGVETLGEGGAVDPYEGPARERPTNVIHHGECVPELLRHHNNGPSDIRI